MDMHSDIDHITGIDKSLFDFELIATEEIFSTTTVSHPPAFYSRAPTPGEFWQMHFEEAPPGTLSQVSDHPGYLSQIKISRREEPPRNVTGTTMEQAL